MAKFVFELLDGYAETSLFLPTAGELVFLFSPRLQGFVTVGDRSYEVLDGRAVIPEKELPRGEFLPELVTKEGKWELPRLVYDGERVYPKPYDDEFIRELNRKLTEMTEKVKKIAADARELREKIYGRFIL